MAFDPVIASITLTGSALSALATSCVLVCFIVFRENHRTFRHSLVLGLTIADFLNATNNTVSGIIYIRDHELYDSPACEFNGWLGQLSVQATDFSILAISVATLLIVTRQARLSTFSTKRTVLICLSVWLMPLITSTTALAMGEMDPVSGNWCWISRDRTDLRYGLTHGWRFAIVATTIGIYSYVWWYLARHFKSMAAISDPVSSSSRKARFGPSALRSRSRSYVDMESTNDQEDDHELIETNNQARADPFHSSKPTPGAKPGEMRNVSETQSSQPTVASNQLRDRSNQNLRDVRRMLILNGYPMLYVLLWIPGIVNRIMEASGSTASRPLAILQTSTQFVGFANAITYGINGTWRPNK